MYCFTACNIHACVVIDSHNKLTSNADLDDKPTMDNGSIPVIIIVVLGTILFIIKTSTVKLIIE